MTSVQVFDPIEWRGAAALAPGQSVPISTDILVPEPPEREALVFVVSARAIRTSPHTYSVAVDDVRVVTNDPPGGLNLNLHLVNAHATEPLEAAVISIAAISSATALD